MGNSSSTPKVTAQDKAILDLKVQRDKLRQYQTRITHLTALETQAARNALAEHNRRGALLALRRKKYQESLLQKTDQQLAQLQALAAEVEFALVQKDVVYGLQRGTEVLKEINKEMGGVAGVEKLMGRNEDERAYQEEISEMLNGQLSTEEEDDVEKELRLMAGEKEEVLPVPPRTVPAKEEKELPDAPNSDSDRQEQTIERRERAEEPVPA